MRKILLELLAIILLAFSIYVAVYGLALGNIKVNGIIEISQKNDLLERKIQSVSKLKNSDYPQTVSVLESSYKKLKTEKENYEQIVALGVDENGKTLNKMQEYEIETIWITLGNYAKKQGVDLKLDMTLNNSISGTYDLNFTVTGGYIQIIDFLYDVERDSTLMWKLENFKLQPGAEVKEDEKNTEKLDATFTCRDIKITKPMILPEILEEDKEKINEESTETTDDDNKTTTETTDKQ